MKIDFTLKKSNILRVNSSTNKVVGSSGTYSHTVSICFKSRRVIFHEIPTIAVRFSKDRGEDTETRKKGFDELLK